MENTHILQNTNYNIQDIQTPVKVENLKKLLLESGYPERERNFLLQGFGQGFDINYTGPLNRQDSSRNLPFTVGNKTELWNKVMKEVGEKRYARPFSSIPFKNYVQSPIGLVPKRENQMRLIFHLSFDFKKNKSVSHHTPRTSCTVQYKDLDFTIREALQLVELWIGDRKPILFFGKSDIKSAFRLLPLFPGVYWLLVMKAQMDKCLPFGHSISCALFQKFSDALAHMTKHLIQRKNIAEHTALTNYVDDFLFAALTKLICDQQLQTFLDMCGDLECQYRLRKQSGHQT